MSKSDYGTYIATGTNTFGSATTQCQLRTVGVAPEEALPRSDHDVPAQIVNTVTIPEVVPEAVPSTPKTPPTVSELTNTSFKEGDKLVLQVDVTSSSAFEVEWLCNGQMFQADADNLTIIETNDTSSRLILDDVNEDDSGTYTVKVTNEAGTTEEQCEITVEKAHPAPEFTVIPDEVDCVLNETVVIQVQAVAMTSAFWLADGKTEAEINGTEAKVTLNITEDTQKSGLFIIIGPGGEAQKSIALNIQPQTKGNNSNTVDVPLS